MMFKGSMPDVWLTSLMDQWLTFILCISLMSGWLFYFQRKWQILHSANQHNDKIWLKYLPNTFVLLCAMIGVYRAWQIMWIGDDAFISLRYSDMFAQGEGLVFNRGEWVEGYTNFLWTFLLGLVGKIGISLPHAAIIGNLLCFIGSIFTCKAISTRLQLSIYPAIVFSACYPSIVFATSGLETMPAVFCVLLGAYLLICSRLAWAGCAFVAAAMMRPDHILFWGCGGLSLLLTHLRNNQGSFLQRLEWKNYFIYAATLFTVYIPYFIWRIQAYGEFFPNTYYAKSGNLSYWKQGGIYLSSFLLGSGTWWILLIFLLSGIFFMWRTFFVTEQVSIEAVNALELNVEKIQASSQKEPPHTHSHQTDLETEVVSENIIHESETSHHQELNIVYQQSDVNEEQKVSSLTGSRLNHLRQFFGLFCILSTCIFTTYVVKVGGDLMLYRFFIVLIPLFWFLLSFLSQKSTWQRIALILAVSFAITPIELVKPQKKKWGLAAEETFYEVNSFVPLELDSRYVLIGKILNSLKQETQNVMRVAVDCVGMIGFYGDVHIFDLFGLTSPRVAHKPLKKRGRPGHEKFGTLRDALAEKSTFSTVDLWRRSGFRKMYSYTQAIIKGRSLYFLIYDQDIFDGLSRLKAKGVEVKLPLSLSKAILKIKQEAQKGPNLKLLKFLKRFYQEVIPKNNELKQAIQVLQEAKKPVRTYQKLPNKNSQSTKKESTLDKTNKASPKKANKASSKSSLLKTYLSQKPVKNKNKIKAKSKKRRSRKNKKTKSRTQKK